MAMFNLCNLPLARLIVNASNKAWVGCSCRQSPAFNTAHLTFSANKFIAPDCGWRTTSRSGFMAFNVIAVSMSVSPFLIEEAPTAKLKTSAFKRFPASSNEANVLVEFSKKHIDLSHAAKSATLFLLFPVQI